MLALRMARATAMPPILPICISMMITSGSKSMTSSNAVRGSSTSRTSVPESLRAAAIWFCTQEASATSSTFDISGTVVGARLGGSIGSGEMAARGIDSWDHVLSTMS